MTEAVNFVSSAGILFVCDFLVLGTLVFYIVWFNLNVRSRFSDEDCSGREPLVQQAYYLKRDWCRGSLIFAGWRSVTQGASLIFSLMVLVDMAYANLVSPVEITGRVVIYTAVSLFSGFQGRCFGSLFWLKLIAVLMLRLTMLFFSTKRVRICPVARSCRFCREVSLMARNSFRSLTHYEAHRCFYS